MVPDEKPLRIISSVAPIRIADFGGWTDTWFAKFGKVLSIAVYPYAEVQIRVFARHDGRPPVTIYAENYGERYTLEAVGGTYDRHPLLEAALEFMGVPHELALEIDIFSEAPAAVPRGRVPAVSVALIGALDLLKPGRLTPTKWPGPPTASNGVPAPAVRRSGPTGLGLRGHQLHRDPGVSPRGGQPLAPAAGDPVGVGRAAFLDLPGPVPQLVEGPRAGDCRAGGCRAGTLRNSARCGAPRSVPATPSTPAISMPWGEP